MRSIYAEALYLGNRDVAKRRVQLMLTQKCLALVWVAWFYVRNIKIF